LEFDLFYEVMVPAEWTEAIERRVYAETLEQLEFADTLGYNTAWIARHHGTAGFSHTSSPEIIFGALSTRTSRLRFGFGVELLPLVHPVFVAERTATLDLISHGRVEVGTGRTMGLNQLRLFGVNIESTRERWLESIRLLPRLWTEKDVVHEGKYWQWQAPITTVPRTIQKPHPPLWVAASRNETARLAGTHGLGMLMSSFRSPADLIDDFAAYKEAIRHPTDQIGHFRNDQASVVCVAVCHDPNDSAANQRARAASLYYLGKVRKGYGENQGAGASINTIPDEDVFEKGILRVGDPDYMVQSVKEYQAIGADRMMLLIQLAGLPHTDVMRSLELFGKRVIPQFQRVAVA
jgi:alkanesulfonate monooxygenase SsuD/methylene tetrahydromethanopterin reductase-like flavin-dependent oxidoreductase (luciferase family)